MIDNLEKRLDELYPKKTLARDFVDLQLAWLQLTLEAADVCKIPQLANRLSSVIRTIQAWAYRMSIEDQKKLSHVFRFGSHPKEFIDVMVDKHQVL